MVVVVLVVVRIGLSGGGGLLPPLPPSVPPFELAAVSRFCSSDDEPLVFAALSLVVLLLRLEVRTVVSLSPSSFSTAAPLSVGFVGPLRFVFVFEVVPANWLTRSSI